MNNALPEVGGGGSTSIDIDLNQHVPVPTRLSPVSDQLTPPADGDKKLDHNETFEDWSGVFDDVRNAINDGIGKLNGVLDTIGLSEIPKLPEESLEELLIEPLTGDYGMIRGNANACINVNNAMKKWSNNFLYVSGSVAPTKWDGECALAFVGHMGIYALVTRALGGVVEVGKHIFNGIALVSESIAVRVEGAIVALGKLLEKLAKKIASRFAGAIGWALLVKDIISDGIDVIQDIYDDIIMVRDLIQQAKDLKDEVEAWADVQRERLEAFKDLPDLVRQLPAVGSALSTGSIPPNLAGTLEQLLNTVDVFSYSEEEAALMDRLRDLGLLSDEAEDRAG